MKICNDCGLVFCDSEARVSKQFLSAYRGGSYEYYYICPKCGSMEIEEGVRCTKCRTYHTAEDVLDGLCSDCRTELEVRLFRGVKVELESNFTSRELRWLMDNMNTDLFPSVIARLLSAEGEVQHG